MAEKKHRCEDCGARKHAEAHLESLRARLWRWHTSWCPGWKSYQRSLSDAK